MSSLAHTQALFFRAVAQLEGEASDPELNDVFVSRGPLTGAERVRIYADMFWWRQLDALRACVPKLAALIGDEPFRTLARAYLRAHPSRHYDLGAISEQVPEYLRTRDDLRADLADLAQLEWTRDVVHAAANVDAVGPEALAAAGERLVSARLTFVPALAVRTFAHQVTPVWRALEDGAAAPEPSPTPEVVAFWRRGFEVVHGVLPPMEADALARGREGATVAEICEAFLDTERPAQAAFDVLASWVHEGWIAAVEAG